MALVLLGLFFDSLELRVKYSQANTYANISRPTFKQVSSKTVGSKLTNSQATIVKDNNFLESKELIEVAFPVTRVEVPEVKVFEVGIPEIEVPEVEVPQAKIQPIPKTEPVKFRTAEKSEQYQQAEKRLNGFIVLFLVLLTIGSSF